MNEQALEALRSEVSNMSKAEVRESFKALYLWDDNGRSAWLFAIKRMAQADSVDLTVDRLLTLASRRDRHDDPVSRDQALFTAIVLRVFGPKGLTF